MGFFVERCKKAHALNSNYYDDGGGYEHYGWLIMNFGGFGDPSFWGRRLRFFKI